MIIVGEKLNSSIPAAGEAFKNEDGDFIAKLAKEQCAAGVHYIDINASLAPDETKALIWAAKIAQNTVNCGIMVDSPNPDAVAALYESVTFSSSIINSVTLDPARLRGILPIVSKYNTGIVALPIGEGGMPETAEQRVENADKLIGILREHGIGMDRIYLDILVEAAGANFEAPLQALLATRMLREKHPDIHLLAGLSNVSFGLPGRAVINRAFLSCAMTMGLDAAILDPLNAELMLTLRACDMLLGRDEYCMEYITAYRALHDN